MATNPSDQLTWLYTPPTQRVRPPAETAAQDLPFGELSWEDFERLCLRLVGLEADVEHYQPYGTRGQEQGGIDIYARRRHDQRYAVYQCKRVAKFGPAQIEKAVETFLTGDWVDRSDTFVLCTSASLTSSRRAEALEKQSAVLASRGIRLVSWDSVMLSERLKDLPEVVDDFFGREWVRIFCGQAQAEALGDRLTAEEVARLRDRLSRLYGNVFDEQDPGLPVSADSDMPSPTLEDRYVLPDVYEGRAVGFAREESPSDDEIHERRALEDELRSSVFDPGLLEEVRRRPAKAYQPPISYRQRRSAEDWLASGIRNVVLGGPGSGKSSLLRFVAKDLLQERPRLASIAREWGGFLPVWVPFAFWAKSISEPALTVRSLSEVVRRWLVHFDEEQLWPLLGKALRDERLLLLVDGLDEYIDESAAAVALGQLQVFVTQRGVPAVVTSRPHGFDRLGMQATGWRIAELAGFSHVQQEELARTWFLHRARSAQPDPPPKDRTVEDLSEAQAARFIGELRRSEDFNDLAQVPLLLSLLIYLRFANARLPQGRFKAYKAIIDHLISTHPYKRRAAALLTEGAPSELSDDEVEDCFAYLAYRVQEASGEGLIERAEAIAVLKEYLMDEDLGLGYGLHEARRIGRDLAAVGAETVGLLVERSPTELGYFHRAFQEFLAAVHLARIPPERQLEVLKERRADPRWREVLLGLFHLTRRPADTRAFAEQILNEEGRLSQVEQHTVDHLLCEVACGDFNVSVSLAKELAGRAIGYIELGSWMPQREQLLGQLLEGLRSSKVRDLVLAKVVEWFPCRTQHRQSLIAAVGSWPLVPHTVNTLWKGMHDEETNHRRTAARALAALAAGDLDIGKQVASLALGSIDPDIRAAAVECLLHGWPGHEDLRDILREARSSLSPELRLVAIMGRVQLNEHDEGDREELLRFSSRSSHIDYYWKGEVAPTLMAGWPRSRETKELCLADLRKPLQESRMDPDVASRILLEGYSQDEEVAEYCAEEILTEEFPFIMLRHEAWRLLAQNFRDHPKVVSAIDELIMKQERRYFPELEEVALIGRTPLVKAKLLSLLDSSGLDHQYARVLLEGWGMQDVEVAEKLRQVAFGPAAKASRLGAILPQIIDDREECRARLMELLQDPECELPNAVIKGLMTLGANELGTEVVDEVFDKISQRRDADDVVYRGVAGLLLEWQSSDARVRGLAEEELTRRNDWYGGLYHIVARAYGSDEDMRRKVAAIVNPLPTLLRQTIAVRLGAGYVSGDSSLPVLGLYDYEPDGSVKVQASIGYHERLRDSGQDIDPVIRRLSEDIVAYGPDLDERRQGAFCGLVSLNRLDTFLEVRERRGEDRLVKVGMHDGLMPNVPMLRHVLQHWDYIESTLGKERWNRVGLYRHHNGEENLYELWETFCAFADEYPSPREEALDFFERTEERAVGANSLRFLGRVRPRSGLLLGYCLSTLRKGPGSVRAYSVEDASVVAAELLGQHFGGDEDVLRHLTQESDDAVPDEATTMALCEGWPDSDELERSYRILRNLELPMSYAAYFRLAWRKADSQTFYDYFTDVLVRLASRKSFGLNSPQQIVHPITARLRTDEELVTLLYERLRSAPTPSETATLPQLIASSRGVSDDLRDWCNEQMARQTGPEVAPEIGFDLSIGALVPVKHSLLSALDARLARP